MGNSLEDKAKRLIEQISLSDPSFIWKLEASRLEEMRERVNDLRAGKEVSPPPDLPPIKKPRIRGRTHLPIGDSHSDPDYSNHRYEWLGRLATDLKPDIIIDIGDWGTFRSLSTFALDGSAEAENTRYSADIDCFIDAQWRFKKQIEDYNRPLAKKERYNPRLVRCLGNHEWRITRAVEKDPVRLQNVIGIHDLMSNEFGWEEYSYLEPVEIDGILYCHNFRRKGRTRGTSKYGHYHLAAEEGMSTIYGHSHERKHAININSVGRIWHSLNIGCYFEHFELFADQDNQRWARGLNILRNVQEGDFDDEWISMDRIKARYG